MTVDFSTLVLGPAMNAFAGPITITPIKSNPSSAAYANRAVPRVRNVDVATEGGAILSARVVTFGIRNSEYTVLPQSGDRITYTDADGITTTFVIDDTDPDGEGGTTLLVREYEGGNV